MKASEISPCPHRAVISFPSTADGQAVECQLLRSILGWRIGFDLVACAECQGRPNAMTRESEFIRARALDSLLRRVQNWPLDGDGKEVGRQSAVTTEEAVKTLRDFVNEEKAADTLVEAVRRGMPQEKALDIATRILPRLL